MEFSVIGTSKMSLYTKIPPNVVKICNFKNFCISKGLNFGQSQRFLYVSKSAIDLTLRASSSTAPVKAVAASVSEKASKNSRAKPTSNVKVYVGLPLDIVSNCNSINHARAIAAGLKALKLLGVEGVELPIFWGIAEQEAMGKYNWTNYLTIVEMVEKLGLKLHVSLCFHGSEEAKIPLPQWVSQVGEAEPSIYFTDRSGNQYKDCLSLAVDDVPVLNGKTPLDVYKGFFENFKASFSRFMDSTITGVSIGLGPDGELRYPSDHKTGTRQGAGEFQCYDKYMLSNLKHHAETHGNPLWGLGGPHDAPNYDQSPLSQGFFKENGGSWETPYGDFFLSWYSDQLTRHGDRVLSLAASTFEGVPISGKIPLIPSWYNGRSHPSELAAGFYNTANRDGYEAVLDIFSRYSCKTIIPGMDLSDEDQPSDTRSSPESLFAQITSSCRKHRVEVCGQTSSVCGGSRGFSMIKKNLLGKNAVDLFTYQRMGLQFFSPEHFSSFARFVRGLNDPIERLVHVLVEEEGSTDSISDTNMHMQAA